MKKIMKNTLMFMMMFMMSFSLFSQSTNPIEEFGYQKTPFVSNGWYVNGTEIISNTQDDFIGMKGETIETTSKVDKTLDVNYGGFISTTETSQIIISERIISGYTDLSVEISISGSIGSFNSVILTVYDTNGLMMGTYLLTTPSLQNFDINDMTDSIVLTIDVNLTSPITNETFTFGSFTLFGDTIVTTNIQENITDNFNVYSYNKNLVVKTTEFDDYALTVYNLGGQEVFNTQVTSGNNEYQLDLPTGLYIVNLIVGQTVVPKKIMIQ